MKLRIIHGGLLAGLLISGAPGYAGVITGVGATAFPPASTGSIGPVGVTPAPNNDEADATNPNTIPYPSLFVNSLGVLDVEYLVADSGGVTEYRVLQSLLVNNTGQAWPGFQFELGFGIGAAFTPSGPADALDFDTPGQDPAPTASRFARGERHADTLVWTEGLIPSIGSGTFALALDVPDHLAGVHPGGVNRFTLRQRPLLNAVTIPAPATGWLLGAGRTVT